MKMFRQLLTFYTRNLVDKPVITRSIVSACLASTGDVIAQQIIEKRGDKHDFFRTLRMGFFGGCIAGPALSIWHPFLDRSVRFKRKSLATISRVALDQTLYAPFIIGMFFSVQGLLEYRKFELIKQKLDKGYFTALKNNYRIWPIAQLINFWLVPLTHRVLFINLVALGWNTYLSWLNQRTRMVTEMTTKQIQ
ncbi:Protein required for ethanol metabolism [Basidiobolus ranarum]|uniref:Protein required for ethanol metabolism n=1 Tax=Basidiobolus ranarum TaxID=34480 RepID=A0ABR2WRL5_9FUNG